MYFLITNSINTNRYDDVYADIMAQPLQEFTQFINKYRTATGAFQSMDKTANPPKQAGMLSTSTYTQSKADAYFTVPQKVAG